MLISREKTLFTIIKINIPDVENPTSIKCNAMNTRDYVYNREGKNRKIKSKSYYNITFHGTAEFIKEIINRYQQHVLKNIEIKEQISQMFYDYNLTKLNLAKEKGVGVEDIKIEPMKLPKYHTFDIYSTLTTYESNYVNRKTYQKINSFECDFAGKNEQFYNKNECFYLCDNLIDKGFVLDYKKPVPKNEFAKEVFEFDEEVFIPNAQFKVAIPKLNLKFEVQQTEDEKYQTLIAIPSFLDVGKNIKSLNFKEEKITVAKKIDVFIDKNGDKWIETENTNVLERFDKAKLKKKAKKTPKVIFKQPFDLKEMLIKNIANKNHIELIKVDKKTGLEENANLTQNTMSENNEEKELERQKRIDKLINNS